MQHDNTYLFSEMPVRRAVLSLAIPTVLSQIITVVYNMADTFFIGKLNDPNQVAAATICMPAFILINAVANLFGIGGASKISRSLGAGDPETARKTASFCAWTALLAALAYGLLFLLVRPALLPLLGADEETLHFCCQYTLWTVTIGAVPTALSAGVAHLIRADGFARQAGFGIAMGGILNILLDPIFIFVFRLEIAGAAIATMISNTAAASYFLLFLYRKRGQTVVSIHPKYYTARDHIATDVLTSGLPSCVMSMMASVSNGVLNSMIAEYSNTAVAGFGIAKKIDMIAFAVAQGMTQGTLPLIGYNFASGNRKRMTQSIRTTLLLALGIAVTANVTLFFLAPQITRLFIADAETVGYGKQFLKIISFTCPPSAANFMIITVFQATKRRVEPLILSMMRKGSVDIPLMFLLRRFAGLNGIAAATPIADWLTLLVSMLLFFPYLHRIRQQPLPKEA